MRQRGVPAFMILNDASLADLCRREPQSLDDLLEVTGIGEKKAQRRSRKEILSNDPHHFCDALKFVHPSELLVSRKIDLTRQEAIQMKNVILWRR